MYNAILILLAIVAVLAPLFSLYCIINKHFSASPDLQTDGDDKNDYNYIFDTSNNIELAGYTDIQINIRQSEVDKIINQCLSAEITHITEIDIRQIIDDCMCEFA